MSIVPADNIAVVRAMPSEQQAVAITSMLTEARSWLAHALESTGPETIANFKAQMATVAEATKQLGLSKEIQLDAQEMVRRAERGVGQAIRKGQAEGSILRRGEHVSHRSEEQRPPVRPTDFGSPSELYGNGSSGGVIEFADTHDDDFDAAIDEAKAEGNLSRANVARKAREKAGQPKAKPRRPLTDSARDAGWDLRKAVERLQRITADDRFAANAEQVAPHLRSHLTNAIEVCQDLLERINNN